MSNVSSPEMYHVLKRDRERLDEIERHRQEAASLREQLEALRPYVQHRSTCILNISRSVLREASWCDCGLTALLASNPANRSIDTCDECAKHNVGPCPHVSSPAKSPIP